MELIHNNYIMIDTITANITTEGLGKIKELEEERYLNHNKDLKLRYFVKNIIVKYSITQSGQYRIWVSGSLPKFLYGTNMVRFTRKDAFKAINALTNILGIDLGRAELTRIDVGANLSLNHSPSSYTTLLATKTRNKKTTYNNNQTVYFGAKSCVMFYDKILEFRQDKAITKAVKDKFSSFLIQKNLLRYELKNVNLLDIDSSSSKITLSDLYDPNVYRQLVDIWYKGYKAVRKDTLMDFKSPKTFNDYLRARGMQSIGSLVKLLEHLEAFSKYKNLTSQQKCNLKSELLKGFSGRVKNTLIKELDEKIEFQKEFYL